MIGDVAAPVGVDDICAQGLDIDEQMLERCAIAERDDVIVLEKKKVIVPTGDELALKRQRVAIPNSAEPANPQVQVMLDVGANGSGQWISASQSRVSMISWIRWRNAAA